MNLLMKGGGGGGARAPSAPPLDPPLDVVSRILLGLQAMQSELKSVRQGQDETARMVRESQLN